MVETITPVVHGKRSSYRIAALLHVVGTTATAAATGLFLGGLGAITGAPWGRTGVIAIGAVAVLYFGREALGLPIPLPAARRQVPEWWRTFYAPPTTALLYGLGLGAAFVTFLSFGTYVAVVAAAITSGSPLLGAALCAPFGLARGLSVTVAVSAWGAQAVEHLEHLASRGAPRTVNAAALAALAGGALLVVA